MAKRKNNFGKVLLSFALIGVTAGVGFLSSGFTNWNVEEWFQISSTEDGAFIDGQLSTHLKEENGVELKVKKSSIASKFGSQTIGYTINPSNNINDEILYSVNYLDGSPTENEITIIHNDEKRELTISCNKVFTKQIILTLYSKNDENVNAKLYVDFIEKLNVKQTLVIAEDKPLSTINEITSSGGSILIDKTIQSESLSFNTDFIDKAVNYMKIDGLSAIENSEFKGWTEDNGDKLILAEEYYLSARYEEITPEEYFAKDIQYSVIGLDNSSVNNLTKQNFSYDNFVNSIYLHITNIKYDVETADGHDFLSAKKDGLFDMKIANISREHFNDLFNGEAPVFDYSIKINNRDYTSSFALKIENLNITSISINKTNITF